VDYPAGGTQTVTMHDGSRLILRKLAPDYDPTSRGAALQAIQQHAERAEFLTGLLYASTGQPDFHELNATPEEPLNALPYERLNPGAPALAKTLARYR
ncbi:MAG TPA: hypothetical protein VKT19_03280, partial [Steroidobacteraceae bacterium]|nr:hypothetical protein [Steroidobacteraceae bacterium]